MTPIRVILASAATLSVLTIAGQAGAVSLAVKMACASDYHAHCSQHPSGSAGARQCMRAHSAQLSKGCINALTGSKVAAK
jgi:hypothetical protein